MTDLEIYIRDVDIAALEQWLSNALDELQVTREQSASSGVWKARGLFSGTALSVTLYPQAFGKRFASLVIEGGGLPWDSDLACARAAWEALGTEIRCSPGEWQEGDPVEDEKWWRLDERGEQLAAWN